METRRERTLKKWIELSGNIDVRISCSFVEGVSIVLNEEFIIDTICSVSCNLFVSFKLESVDFKLSTVCNVTTISCNIESISWNFKSASCKLVCKFDSSLIYSVN